jgi:hypothetical protein
MATNTVPEKCWYCIYKASYAHAVTNAPPVAEVRGLRAAEERYRRLNEGLTPEERADGVFFFLDDGTARPRLPRPPSSSSLPRPAQTRTGSRRTAGR